MRRLYIYCASVVTVTYCMMHIQTIHMLGVISLRASICVLSQENNASKHSSTKLPHLFIHVLPEYYKTYVLAYCT